MKKFLFVIIILIAATQSFAQIKSATLTAGGLTCSMCSKAVYKSLVKLSFVQDIQADVETAKYIIRFKPGSEVIIDQVKKAVEDAGFSVASLQVTANFTNTEVYNDAHVALQSNNLHFLNVSKQLLNGEKTFTVVDKNFLSAKERKKYAQYTKMSCFETGMMADCCAKKGAGGKRIYHVTL